MIRNRWAVFVFIYEYIREHGRPPNYREMVEGTSYKTKSGIWLALKRLGEAGLIKQEEGKTGTLRILPTVGRVTEKGRITGYTLNGEVYWI